MPIYDHDEHQDYIRVVIGKHNDCVAKILFFNEKNQENNNDNEELKSFKV